MKVKPLGGYPFCNLYSLKNVAVWETVYYPKSAMPYVQCSPVTMHESITTTYQCLAI